MLADLNEKTKQNDEDTECKMQKCHLENENLSWRHVQVQYQRKGGAGNTISFIQITL